MSGDEAVVHNVGGEVDDPRTEAMAAVMVAVSAYTEAALTAGTVRGKPPQMKELHDAVRRAVRAYAAAELGYANINPAKYALACIRARLAELRQEE